MRSCTKRRRRKKSCLAPCSSSAADFISNLDDNVLGNIFSRMPLKDAVRTSILSKDWKYKWMSLYAIEINYEHWKSHTQSFVNFMNTTLPSIQCLRFFDFRCEGCEFSARFAENNDFQKWISAVLEHNLEIFKVELGCRGLLLPYNLLNSTLLRQLRFDCGISRLNVVVKNVAPKLTSLLLKGVEIVNGNPTLTFTFPVLEKLTFIECNWPNVKSVEIYAPSLTQFTSTGMNDMEDYDYSIVIVAPRLTFLYAEGDDIPENIIVKNPSSVVSTYLTGCYETSADRSIRRAIGLRIRNLLNSFTNLEELVLHGTLAKAVLPFRANNKLRRLTLYWLCNNKTLFEFLDAAPSLKFLCVAVGNWRTYNYEALDTLPACITSHLEEVVFKRFESTAAQLDLAKLFLKNAQQLKEFRIAGYDLPEPEEEIIESHEFLYMPRHRFRQNHP